MVKPIRVALVGLGKIARDQHIPTIEGSPDFEIATIVSRAGSHDRYEVFRSLKEAITSGPSIDAVSLCTPPQVRVSLCREAAAAGLAVLVEKPPAKTIGEARTLIQISEMYRAPFFFAWHSRFAPFVAEAAEWTANRSIVNARIYWKEDAQKWHPGQHWLWQPGGFGVFDPGINALSILTTLLQGPVQMVRSHFLTRDSDQTPISAELNFIIGSTNVMGTFDFRERESEIWALHLEDDNGELLELHGGGAEITVNGETRRVAPENEYCGMYRRFSEIVRTKVSDCDVTPLEIVADAYLVARWSRGAH